VSTCKHILKFFVSVLYQIDDNDDDDDDDDNNNNNNNDTSDGRITERICGMMSASKI
jgi:hypothetical protein